MSFGTRYIATMTTDGHETERASVTPAGARRSRLRAVALAIAVLALVAVAVVPALAATRRDPELGSFAGEVLAAGGLHSVAGSWVVPRARAADRNGAVAVWIGAQGPGDRATAPFIQVGVDIERGGSGRVRDTAFWTDSERRFRPQTLMPVAAGDRVSARLVRTGGRWQVSLEDLTRHATGAIVTAEEGAASFDEAEWLQEDPSVSDDGAGHAPRYPYAAVTTVRFTGLGADGAAPAPAALQSTWLSLGATDLGPTPPADDAFSIVPRRLVPAAARYVALALPEDRAASTFAAALAPWLEGVPGARIGAAAAQLTTTLRRFARGLAGPGWGAPAATAGPGSAARVRAALRAAVTRFGSVVAQAPAAAPTARGAWDARYAAAALQMRVAGRALRRGLGAPDLVAPGR